MAIWWLHIPANPWNWNRLGAGSDLLASPAWVPFFGWPPSPFGRGPSSMFAGRGQVDHYPWTFKLLEFRGVLDMPKSTF